MQRTGRLGLVGYLPLLGRRQPIGKALSGIHQVQHVFKSKHVLHGAAFKVTTVGQHLFGYLAREYAQP